MNAKEYLQKLLQGADVEINGSSPWDPRVHDERLYGRVLREGSLGLGEAYMDGWWDAPSLDRLFDKVLSANLDRRVRSVNLLFHVLKARLFNLQNISRAFRIGEAHYDVGNDLYRAMLDKRMVYTCGYWSGDPPAGNLDEAQEAKLDLVCRKIGLKRGQRVLDIGGGWGSFGKFAAERYGARVVTVTVSRKQAELGRTLTKGLPVEIRVQDYRDISDGPFDRIVSLGMFEHVGHKNYRTYFDVAHRLLSDDGLLLLHTIGGNKTVYATDPWIDRYIFPGGMLPSIAQIGKAIEGLFIMEDWHNFGPDYDKTLLEWFANFDRAWPKLKQAYDERFYRMWKYYLLASAASFRARKNQLWQIVLSKRGVRSGYQSVR